MDLELVSRRTGRPLRILVTRLRYLGDVIITTPVIGAIKRRYRDAEIHYLAESQYAPVLEGHPDLSGVIRLERGASAALRTVRHIRDLRFVAALDLFYNPRSAWILYFGGIPVRIGGARRGRRRLYTDILSVPEGIRSAVSHHLHAAGCLGISETDGLPHVFIADGEVERGSRLVGEIFGREDRDEPLVAVHPGGTWPAKRWAPESYAALSARMRDSLGARVIVIAGPGEEDIASAVVDGAGENVRMLPRQPVRGLGAVLAGCDVIVTNDGGVMHLAVALGRPTVGVFGPTEPDIWFPYEGKGPFVLVTRHEGCAPCHLHHCDHRICLERIEPAEVYERVEDLITKVRR